MKADEPLHIPETQQKRIELEQRNGWKLIGWVEEEAVLSMGDWWGRVLKDGSVSPNLPMEQDKSLALTNAYSGMRYTGIEFIPKTQTSINRDGYLRTKSSKRIRSLCNT